MERVTISRADIRDSALPCTSSSAAMEALHSFAPSSVLQQMERRAHSSSSGLCSSSHFCVELCTPNLRALTSSRSPSIKACLRAEDAGDIPLSFSSRSKFGVNFSASPSLPLRLHSCRIYSAKKTYSSFDDLLKITDTPLLVDFYATWCGPCQFMVPILDNVGRALKDKLRIVKIDSEKYPTIASRYGVQALPTMILFQNGKPIDRLEGALSAPDLIKRIEEVLSATSRAN